MTPSSDQGERSGEYDAPDSYRNLDDSISPIHHADEEHEQHVPPATPGSRPRRSLSLAASAREERNVRRQSRVSRVDYDVPDSYVNLDEVIDVSPVQNPDEEPIRRYESLELVRTRDQEYIRDQRIRRQSLVSAPGAIPGVSEKREEERKIQVSRLATQIYTVSYLILFSILGTLARLGLQALTSYPGTPVIFASIWPNFSGTFIMGFLAEDRALFRLTTPEPQESSPNNITSGDEESNSSSTAGAPPHDPAAAKKAHTAAKKTIPLYIGLATGFCGSFTSFSAFVRDLFLALSNDLSPTSPRNGGYSLAAVLAVLVTTVSLSLSALFLGAHLAIAIEPLIPSLPYLFTRKVLDRLVVPLACAVWLAAVLLCVFPPDHFADTTQESWRGAATFALAFAPLGCLARFYASLRLNGRIASFPLGTYAVNIAGTAVLGMAWDLAHVPLGGVVGCQVLQGVEDGFCGCLTTVSTWVAELAALRRRHAYVYGGASVAVGLGLLVAIMGGLRWSDGFAELQCIHSL